MEVDLIKDELRQLFNILQKQDYYIYKLQEINSPYDAYFIREGNWKGVGIPISNEEISTTDFLANFENIKVCIQKKQTSNGGKICLLSLLTKKEISIDKFILLCIDFITPGKNGENRDELLKNPQKWVNKWKELLGNKSESDMDYSYLGELIILNYLLENNNDIEITNQGSYDLETKDKNYEIKTTILRYTSVIEIHSQYQLKTLNNNPLELYFVRLEESKEGVSINKILKSIENKNYKNVDKILKRIKEISSESREKNYNILEIRKYDVDNEFPKITIDSFKNNSIPKNIINIKYIIDLEGIKYENIQI